ncbi:unnamed protein product, partial [marine sediment metagenome]
AYVPDGCEGQFQDPSGEFYADVYTVDGDYTIPSSGQTIGPPDEQDKVLGPRWVDLHFQTAEYGLFEPLYEMQSYTRFFGLHCFEPGDHVFEFCNRADVKPPYEEYDPGYDELLCEDLTVHAEEPLVVDKQVWDVRFDYADNTADEGTELDPPNEYTLPVSENHLISVTSDDYNDGPAEPEDTEISFYAYVPAGCEGQFQDPDPTSGYFPFDVYTVDGDYTIPSSGQTTTQTKSWARGGWTCTSRPSSTACLSRSTRCRATPASSGCTAS